MSILINYINQINYRPISMIMDDNILFFISINVEFRLRMICLCTVI